MNNHKKMNYVRMAQNRRMNEDTVQLRKRIMSNRARARNVGLLYLLASIALTCVVWLPLVAYTIAYIGSDAADKVFFEFNVATVGGMKRVIAACVYVLLLLVVLVNTLKSFGKLSWLYKKKANRTFGFNRNVYAMQDLAGLFSGSFAFFIISYFAMAIILGTVTVGLAVLIVVLIGVALRLLLGFWGAKTAYYDIEDKELIEEKRKMGRVVPVVRNLLQFVATFGIIFFTLKANEPSSLIYPFIRKDGLQILMENVMDLVVLILRIVGVICTFVLIKHATAATEYNSEGVKGAGMKNFRIFSLFVFLLVGGAAVVEGVMLQKEWNVNLLITAGIALVIFIVELILCKRPKLFAVEEEKEEDEELSMNNISRDVPEQPTKSEQPIQNVAAQISPFAAGQQTYFVPYPISLSQQPASEQNTQNEEVENRTPIHVEVDCPTCGKRLLINQVLTYHRCPCCQKIFTAETVERYVKPNV